MMRFNSVGLLALSILATTAFQDTSPFFFFSTSEILVSSHRITPAATVYEAILSGLQQCPSDIYVIVSQPGINAVDFHDQYSAPHLRQKISGIDKNIRSSVSVSDVVGRIDAEMLSTTLQKKCGAGLLRVNASSGSFTIPEGKEPLVIMLDFPHLPAEKGRASTIVEHDLFLSSLLKILPSSKYTVLYTTTPTSVAHLSKIAESELFHVDNNFQLPIHMDLKRDFTSHKRLLNSTIAVSNGPLFEKYQFFGPGIFMGLVVFIILFSILYVGITGIAGLQVSYAAFDKEMGPAAQKKQT